MVRGSISTVTHLYERIEELEKQLAAARLAGKIEGMEEAALSVRAACDACNGSGYDARSTSEYDACECEYCGRPMLAIRAKIAELQATTTPALPGSSEPA